MPDQCSQAVAPIAPEQVWAARGLLRWSRERLSSESDVPYGFIVKFERLGHIAPVFSRERGFNGLSAIRQALEAAGVTFTHGDEPGVKLRKVER